MRIPKTIVLKNTGRLIARVNMIDQQLEKLKNDYENAPVENSTYLLGQIAGIEDSRSFKHKEIIDLLVDTKRNLDDCHDFEWIFYKGYIKGLEMVLQVDREIYKDTPNFVFFIYTESEDLFEKYRAAFYTTRCFKPLCGTGIQYFLTSDVKEIESGIEKYGKTNQYVITVVYERRAPSKETMENLAAGGTDFIYLHKDNDEENASDMIYKLIQGSFT